MDLQKITYRKIAIMLAKALPIEAEEFTAKIEENLRTIKALPKTDKVALKSAYIFSAKVPREERQDMFQDITLALLKARTPDEKLGYAIARCDWKNWWRQYKVRQHYSLDSVIEDEDGSPATLADMLIGETEFELKMNGNLDAERIWDMLPVKLQGVVRKRLLGQMVSPFDAGELQRWAGKHAMILA